MIAALLATGPLVGQSVCGDATGRTAVIEPGLMYRILSAGEDELLTSGAYFFAMKGALRNGKLDVVLHGTGHGAGQNDPPGSGQSDTITYTGGAPYRGFGDDVDDLLAVVTAADCFDWAGEVRIYLYVQHGHLDHANQEFIDELDSRAGFTVVRAMFHRDDRDIFLCQDDFGNLLVRPGSGEIADPAAPYCGFLGDPLRFRGHPADVPIVEADWTAIGSSGDTACNTISGPFSSFTLFDGSVGTVALDTAHTNGGLTLRLDFASGEVVSLATVGPGCSYPGARTFGPHP